jgi:GDSL/SGNH-like Acyl-Esterase family found in Pmr5 and Cas1p
MSNKRKINPTRCQENMGKFAVALAALLAAIYYKIIDASTIQNLLRTQGDVAETRSQRRYLKNREGVVSYLQICQAVIGQATFPGEYQFAEVVEDNGVCTDNTRTTTALSRIFISAYLAYQAKMAGFEVSYTHNCDVVHGTKGIIQELLPPQITIQPEFVTPINRQGIVTLCERLDNGLKFDLLRLVVPIIQETLSTIVASVLMQIENGGNLPRHGILNIKKDRNGDPDTAVIFLPCSDKQCSDVWVYPFYSFLQHLPESVQAVDIVTTPACDAALETCRQYVIDLADSLEQFDPTRTVQITIVDPSSIELMTRLMVADHVLCGAGWGKQCLIPALARGPNERGRFVVWEGRRIGNDKEQSTESMFFEAVLLKIGDPDAIARVSSPEKLIPTRSLAELSAKPGMVQEFLRSPPPPGSGICRLLRGKLGQWVQDFKYASQAAYRVPLLHHSGAAETIFRERAPKDGPLEQQFRPSATYRWQETFYSGGCDVPIITKEGICSLLNKMGIGRIFFLGDSLSLEQALSLWMLLGPEQDLLLPDQSSARYVIECPNVDGFSFVLQFIRNDELMNNDTPVSISNQVMNCNNYCYPWVEPYISESLRTLFIVNTGAHLHDRDLFERGMLRFIETFDGLGRVNDIVMIRTLVPGHKNCGRPGLTPYHSFGEYVDDATKEDTKDTYNWGVFSSYNDFVSRLLDDRTQQKILQARMEVLDVFPMTVLRPDGHMADEFKAPETKRTDCLHYSQPGPIDWWNHLMIGNLLDIQVMEEHPSTTQAAS